MSSTGRWCHAVPPRPRAGAPPRPTAPARAAGPAVGRCRVGGRCRAGAAAPCRVPGAAALRTAAPRCAVAPGPVSLPRGGCPVGPRVGAVQGAGAVPSVVVPGPGPPPRRGAVPRAVPAVGWVTAVGHRRVGHRRRPAGAGAGGPSRTAGAGCRVLSRRGRCPRPGAGARRAPPDRAAGRCRTGARAERGGSSPLAPFPVTAAHPAAGRRRVSGDALSATPAGRGRAVRRRARGVRGGVGCPSRGAIPSTGA